MYTLRSFPKTAGRLSHFQPYTIPRVVSRSLAMASQSAPQVRKTDSVHVDVRLLTLKSSAQRSIPIQAGRRLCQRRMGQSKIRQDV